MLWPYRPLLERALTDSADAVASSAAIVGADSARRFVMACNFLVSSSAVEAAKCLRAMPTRTAPSCREKVGPPSRKGVDLINARRPCIGLGTLPLRSGLLRFQSASIPAGMIADATIIAAPSSTKNAAAAREPEMQRTKKGQQWGAIDGHAKRHRDRKDPVRYSCQSSSWVTPTRRSLAWMRTQPHCGKRTELFYEYETF